MHESFLRHRNYFWLKVALLLCIVAIEVYYFDVPLDAPNGGTWLGYTLGTVGALLIVWLAYLGVRKRSYRNAGNVRGWTSAHVYLGLSLLVVATLHTGFQFGLNIHTLAYALMLLVIASGIWGIVAYARYPAQITEARGNQTRERWIADLLELNEQALKLADQIDPEVHRVVVRSNERLRLGGSLRQLLLGGGRRRDDVQAVDRIGERLREKLKSQGAAPPKFTATSQLTVIFMASQIVKGEGEVEIERLQHLLGLVSQRNELADRINADATAHARMVAWLYVHVPLTAALLAALGAHILVVFLYW